VGDSDGFELGCKDGDTDGTLDGTLDGCEVGTDDGIALGDADCASITSTNDTTNLSFIEFVAASRRLSAVKLLDSSRMVTVDSITASTFKFSRRRPSTPVHDTSDRIVTTISTDTPSSSSAAINAALIDFSTSVLSKGQVTSNSDFAKVFTTATIEFDGTSLGEAEGNMDGNELGILVGLTLGKADGDVDGKELGLTLGLTLGKSDGDVDGDKLGLFDGRFDGDAEGFADGDATGN
jgi:hypothetical protein